MNNNILFIEGMQGFMNQAIVKKLEEAEFTVTRIPEDLDEISYRRNEANILLYYPSNRSDRSELIARYLFDLSRDEHKTLSLVGEPQNIEDAKRLDGSERIYSTYPRPIDINKLVDDMMFVSYSHEEYQRMKTILVIDDDDDFLRVMDRWLSGPYKVDGVRSGTEALLYLNRMRPDLILLDYEMPQLDGYQVMEQIRRNTLTSRVPIIFLTGKNDRESVMRILKRKPDGYLLKTVKKEELLDALDRFFADSILTRKISRFP